MNQPWKSMWRQTLNVFALGEDETIKAESVQRAIVKAITNSGVRLMNESILAFGSRMVANVSPEAFEAIRPVQRQLVAAIQNDLPKKLQDAGWVLPNQELRLEVIANPDLVNYEVSLVASDLDVTPREPAASQPRAEIGDQVRLHRLQGGGGPWTLQPGRDYLVGRSGAGNQINLDNCYVSAVHARLTVKTTSSGEILGLLVEDVGSTHGTIVGSRKSRRDAPVLAKHGDPIKLAGPAGESLRVTIGEDYKDSTIGWAHT